MDRFAVHGPRRYRTGERLHRVSAGNEDLQLSGSSNFISVNPDQDLLRFMAPSKARYDLEEAPIHGQ
ncbi:MAG: hypothetical protein IPH00_16900 [Flavobacteriales bacterium]|nr:hypothetical protein [Flavobacteriales bacterium]